MADKWPAVVADWGTAIDTAWPDITRWWLQADLNKYDWETLTRSNSPQFTSPWAVVQAGEFTEWAGPSTQVWYSGVVRFYYITKDDADVEVLIMSKMSAMEQQLKGQVMTGCQVLPGGWGQNWGPDNELNRRLSDQKLDYSAGMFSWNCLVPGASI